MNFPSFGPGRRLKWILWAWVLAPSAFSASTSALSEERPARAETEQRWNLHFQSTMVPQGHGGFAAPGTAPGMLSNASELHTSFTSTLFLGASPWKGTEIYLNPEAGAGSGISGTQGVAAYPNGEIYRVGDPGLKAYLSRVFVRQTFGLGGPQEQLESGANQLAEKVDVSRLVLTAGKFSLNDLIDNNQYAHDPRTQFLNWAFMDNGAWDYAADTRGYTWGVALELNQPRWAIRAATGMVPSNANGPDFDPRVLQAHGDNLELEYRYALAGHPGKARGLFFMNHAFMGSYTETLAQPQLGMDITRTRAYRTRFGAGLNLEQELTEDLGAFARLGWNDGKEETWDFTEIDQVLSLGVSLKGSSWRRGDDTLGAALVIAGLSPEHRQYLGAGGSGFMLGGGLPRYAPETIAELFYRLQLLHGVSASADYQQIFNPGYNPDRGPAAVFAGRVHLEL